MTIAKWNGAILAESSSCIKLEGNYYFPPESINGEYFRKSNSHTTCLWKGQANYYDLEVNGKLNKDAAWYYPDPLPAAEYIRNYIAFRHGVEVMEN